MPQAGQRTAGSQGTPPADDTQNRPAPSDAAQGVSADAGRIKELEAENARLREQLAAAGQTAGPAKPTEPSFTFSEGQRDELERTGRTVSPFTGKRYVGTPDNAREATAEEFAKAKPAKPAEKK